MQRAGNTREPMNPKPTNVHIFARYRFPPYQRAYQLENQILWKHGVWDYVSIIHPGLSREELIVNIYFPLQSASREKFISKAGSAVVAFSPNSSNEVLSTIILSIDGTWTIYTLIESFA
ncbi:hypothetical protein TNCV_2026181 [Trichonephila clavipes]|nr:hypothetical protein TNCV_2026181 [Trichonephila clavipes]